ncbi:MAG: hypothetical protein L6408_03240 [Nanoarchaeota archaeon]|nr:hypothetical protein [Nanoarchaeota archaeon]
MNLINWAKAKEKNLDVWDIGLIKWSVLFITLLAVKFWPVLASLDWYWYLAAGIVVGARPMYRFFR